MKREMTQDQIDEILNRINEINMKEVYEKIKKERQKKTDLGANKIELLYTVAKDDQEKFRKEVFDTIIAGSCHQTTKRELISCRDTIEEQRDISQNAIFFSILSQIILLNPIYASINQGHHALTVLILSILMGNVMIEKYMIKNIQLYREMLARLESDLEFCSAVENYDEAIFDIPYDDMYIELIKKEVDARDAWMEPYLEPIVEYQKTIGSCIK